MEHRRRAGNADHLLVAVGRIREWYERNLARCVNPARWIEYSLSASLMVVLIAPVLV